MSDNSKRSRTFTVILYPESTSYDCVKLIQCIERTYPEYAYILHDKDTYLQNVYDDNNNLIHSGDEIKKAHYHVIFRFQNARYLSSVAEELGLNEHDIEIIKNWKSQVRYLIHEDDPEKVQYSPEDIHSNFSVSKYLISSKEEHLVAKEIFEYISTNEISNHFELMNYVLSSPELYSTYRRNAYTFSELVRYNNRTREIRKNDKYMKAQVIDRQYENGERVLNDFIPETRLRPDDPVKIVLDELEEEIPF